MKKTKEKKMKCEICKEEKVLLLFSTVCGCNSEPNNTAAAQTDFKYEAWIVGIPERQGPYGLFETREDCETWIREMCKDAYKSKKVLSRIEPVFVSHPITNHISVRLDSGTGDYTPYYLGKDIIEVS